MNGAQWLPAVAEHLAAGALVLFAGGDAPAAVAGVPSRQELADRLAQRAGIASGPTLAAVSQRLARRGQRWEFTDFLQRTLLTAPAPLPRWHTLLAALPAAHFISAAYDDLLAQALRTAQRPFDHLLHGSQVAFRTPRTPGLIQLYGWVGQPDTLTVTENDHLQLWDNPVKRPLLDRIRILLEEHHLLVVGQDLTDPTFQQLWSHTLARLGSLTPAAYAIVPNAAADLQTLWADRHLYILPADPLPLLEHMAAS